MKMPKKAMIETLIFFVLFGSAILVRIARMNFCADKRHS
jgi:hypothetical protein